MTSTENTTSSPPLSDHQSNTSQQGNTLQQPSGMANKTVHLVSLGCPKNRVDSEVMLGHLAAEGYTVTDAAEGADLIVVNTCAFIEEAKEESVDAILEMSEIKGKGKAQGKEGVKLVVSGCLSQRYAPQLATEIPEVDLFLGTGNFEGINTALKSAGSHALPIFGQQPSVDKGAEASPLSALNIDRLARHTNRIAPFRYDDAAAMEQGISIPDPDFTMRASSPRMATQSQHSVYLKVSEGCSNRCAFCIIPKLRGAQRSRPMDDILIEFKRFIDNGTVEFNLIAQDLCAYGRDLAERSDLAKLLRALNKEAQRAGRPIWIRCLYMYPKGFTAQVIKAIAECEHVLPYIDIPLQHIADPLLRKMKRGKGGEATKVLMRKLRQEIKGLTIRTTFITGLPGETEADFAELVDFVKELKFERMGVFAYSPEEDTPAATMAGQVDRAVAEQRRDYLMAVQKEISLRQQERMVGQTVTVIVDGVSDETDLLLQGRHAGQAPDIDGLTYITDGTANVGDLVTIAVEQAADYDLAGQMVEVVAVSAG